MPEQGGYRRSKDRSPKAPGVGKSSRRTDTQLIATPNVQEGTDLQQGDRERIRQMQQTQRLGATPQPRVEPRQAQVSPALGPSGTEEVPGHLFDMPSTRPDEDSMVAPEMLPDPDDDKEFILQVLSSAPWGHQKIRDLHERLRKERQVAATGLEPAMPTPIPMPPPEVVEEEAQAQELESEVPEEEILEEDFI